MGAAGPVWAGLGLPLLPLQLLPLTCILIGGLWWGSDASHSLALTAMLPGCRHSHPPPPRPPPPPAVEPEATSDPSVLAPLAGQSWRG